MIQLRAFQKNPIHEAYLLAPESKRQAFYTIWIEPVRKGFRVGKESGGMGKVWQRSFWEFETLKEALDFFQAKIKDKTRPDRKSARKYHLVHSAGMEKNSRFCTQTRKDTY